jgi:hypothetical protein
VEGAALQRRDALMPRAGLRQSIRRACSAPYSIALLRDGVVVGFVGLAQVGRVGVRHGAFLAHPVQRGAGVQAAGEGDADLLLADGKVFEDGGSWMM